MCDGSSVQLKREEEALTFINIIEGLFDIELSVMYRNNIKAYLEENGIQFPDDKVKLGDIVAMLVNKLSGKQLGKLMLDMNDINVGKYILVKKEKKKCQSEKR